MWTQFWDMHSGGGNKLWRHADGTVDANGSWRRTDNGDQPVAMIYIEASEGEARAVFYNRFQRNPDRVTCTCCGSDYSLDTQDDLAQITGYHRNCDYDEKSGGYVERPNKYHDAVVSLNDYLAQPTVHVIRASEITDDERKADIPAEGYVWA
jgi:hypothetical protein